jgi:hypothetical protein
MTIIAEALEVVWLHYFPQDYYGHSTYLGVEELELSIWPLH